MAQSYVVRSTVNGEPLDTFDQPDQAYGYTDAVNRAAGDTVAEVIELARNPRWSRASAPGKVPDAVERATRTSVMPGINVLTR